MLVHFIHFFLVLHFNTIDLQCFGKGCKFLIRIELKLNVKTMFLLGDCKFSTAIFDALKPTIGLGQVNEVFSFVLF